MDGLCPIDVLGDCSDCLIGVSANAHKYQILSLQKSPADDTMASFVELCYADAMHLRAPIYQCTLGFSRWQRTAEPRSCANQPPAPADVYGMREGDKGGK